MIKRIKITFGMIVLNGEPFTRYNLRSLYSHAHQIIVVEGACRSSVSVATPEGHSIDFTYELLNKFKAEEDVEDKIIIVSAKDEGYLDGFWPEKDEMSRAYARRATGNYLWQIDSDEFYRHDDIKKIVEILDSGAQAISFPMITFWGGFDYITDGFYLIRDNAREYHRLFAWGPGYTYSTHRPPTVLDEKGNDVRIKLWLNARDLENYNIYLYHYSLLFPHQVFNKVAYYSTASGEKLQQFGGYNPGIDAWENQAYRLLNKPFRVHNVHQHISWLCRFTGVHPEQIAAMRKDIETKRIPVELRRTEDIEKLLDNCWYVWCSTILKHIAHFQATKCGFTLYTAWMRNVSRMKSVKKLITRKLKL